MAENDEDHIRQYMPVVRRIIILVAVLTAIPVAMWTITAFVRTYVGPPKVPTFQPLAASGTSAPAESASASAADANAAPALIAEAKATTVDGSAKPPAASTDNMVASADADGPALVTATISGDAPPATQAPSDSQALAAPANSNAPNSNAPNSNPPWPDSPSNTAAPATAEGINANAAPATDQAVDGSTQPAASSQTDAASPDGTGQVAAQQPPATNWPAAPPATADALPPGDPIAGPVPLPRRRPRYFVMAQAGIPLPRPRPEDAGPAAAGPSASGNWLHRAFHSPSSGALERPRLSDY